MCRWFNWISTSKTAPVDNAIGMMDVTTGLSCTLQKYQKWLLHFIRWLTATATSIGSRLHEGSDIATDPMAGIVPGSE